MLSHLSLISNDLLYLVKNVYGDTVIPTSAFFVFNSEFSSLIDNFATIVTGKHL